MHRLLTLTLLPLTLLAACQSAPTTRDNPTPADAPPPPPPTPTLGDLRVTLDGAPLPVQSALVTHSGTSARTLLLSTRDIPCEEARESSRAVHEGERVLELRFTPHLQPDGSSRWTLVDLNLDGTRTPERRADLARLTLQQLPADAPTPFAFDQEVVLPANDFFGHPEVRLDLRGGGVARGCGQRAGTFDAPPTSQEQVTLTVAGQRIPIQGAALIGLDTTPRLLLSTTPLTCDGGDNADLTLELHLQPEEGQRAVRARGDLLASQHSTAIPEASLRLNDTSTAVTLQGAFTLGDLPVQLQGAITPLRCP